MIKNIYDRIQCLSIWEHLDQDEKTLLCNRAAVVHYKAGQNVHGLNTRCLGILIVENGILRTYLLSEDGRDVTINRLKKGEVCVLTASCVLNDINFNVQVEAENDCELVLLPAESYEEIMKSNVYAENYIYKKLTGLFSDVINAVEHMLFMDLEQRLTVFLLEEVDASKDNCTIRCTHEQIARAIGSARESVSRCLKQLGEEGVVEVFRGGVRIIDRVALEKKI